MKIKLSNSNPTQAEKNLFLTAGYYCIDRGESLKYSVVYVDANDRKSFPLHLEIDNKMIDYNNSIIFDTLPEVVKITSWLDIDHIYFVFQRMTELGFKRHFIK